MHYVASKYNLLICRNKSFAWLYNSYSGAFAKIEADIYQMIHTTDIDSESPCLYFDELVEQGFLKPKEMDEFYNIQLQSKKAIYDSSTEKLTYVIAPTLQCNLSCVYCYERHLKNKATMSDDIVKALVEYIKKQVTTETKKIQLVWFGGEPLVAYDKIVLFYQLFIPFAEENNIEFDAKMITNGILLDDAKMQFLTEKGHVCKLQITLDGTEANYCKLKGATPEQFRKLFNNIKTALKYCKVIVRFNAKTDNYDDIKKAAKELFEYCEGHSSLSFYMDRIMNYRAELFDADLYSQKEFSEKQQDFEAFIRTFANYGKPSLPQKRITYCGLMKMKNLVVGPEGEFYKCEHFLGQKDKEIGNIQRGVCYTRELYEFLESPTPTKCRKCKLFPLCLGGCPAERKNVPIKERCAVNMKALKAQLKNYAKHVNKK